MTTIGRWGAVPLIGLLLATASGPAEAASTFSAAGAADVANEFAAMQTAVGDPLNGNARGPIAEGRRQINWDAGIVPFDMPRDFFNNPAFPPTRGLVVSTPSNEFRVSNDGTDNEFDSFNPDHPNQFATFSSPRLFSPFDTTLLEIDFFVPATDTPAGVNGFGAIFTDVDIAGLTTIEWFDLEGNLLLKEAVPVAPGDLSFLGAVFDVAVGSVQINLGNATLASGLADGGTNDIVVLDDFIYGEPQAAVGGADVPLPPSMLLLASALGLLGATRRRP